MALPYPIGTENERVVAIEIDSDDQLRVHKGNVGATIASDYVSLNDVHGVIKFDVLINANSSATIALEAAAWPDDYGEVEVFVLGQGRPFNDNELPYTVQAQKSPDRSKRFIFTSGLLRHQGSKFTNGTLGKLDGAGSPAFTGQLDLAPFKSAGTVKYFIAVRVPKNSTGQIEFSTLITFPQRPDLTNKIIKL